MKNFETRKEILEYLENKTLKLMDEQHDSLDNGELEKFRVLQNKVEILIEIQKEILKGE